MALSTEQKQAKRLSANARNRAYHARRRAYREALDAAFVEIQSGP